MFIYWDCKILSGTATFHKRGVLDCNFQNPSEIPVLKKKLPVTEHASSGFKMPSNKEGILKPDDTCKKTTVVGGCFQLVIWVMKIDIILTNSIVSLQNTVSLFIFLFP